jgi:hypothetical protein
MVEQVLVLNCPGTVHRLHVVTFQQPPGKEGIDPGGGLFFGKEGMRDAGKSMASSVIWDKHSSVPWASVSSPVKWG